MEAALIWEPKEGETKGTFHPRRSLTVAFGRKTQPSELVLLILYKGPFCGDVQEILGNVGTWSS